MELRQLRYFCAVAEQLSFTNAANALFVSQSAISQQISTMETELGVQLLERSRHKVALTQAGADLYNRLQVILGELDESVKAARIIDFSRHYAAKMTIGIQDRVEYDAAMTVITEALLETKKAFPHLMIEVIQIPFDQVEQALLQDKVDAVIALGPQGKTPHFSKNLNSKAFVEERVHIAVSRELHNLTAGKFPDDASLEELLGKMPMFVPDAGNQALIDIVFGLYTSHGLPPRVTYCSNVSEVLMRTSLGDGICLLPEIIAGEPGNQRFLRFLQAPLTDAVFFRKVIWRGGTETASLRFFIDAVKPFRSADFLADLAGLDGLLKYED